MPKPEHWEGSPLRVEQIPPVYRQRHNGVDPEDFLIFHVIHGRYVNILYITRKWFSYFLATNYINQWYYVNMTELV